MPTDREVEEIANRLPRLTVDDISNVLDNRVKLEKRKEELEEEVIRLCKSLDSYKDVLKAVPSDVVVERGEAYSLWKSSEDTLNIIGETNERRSIIYENANDETKFGMYLRDYGGYHGYRERWLGCNFTNKEKLIALGKEWVITGTITLDGKTITVRDLK